MDVPNWICALYRSNSQPFVSLNYINMGNFLCWITEVFKMFWGYFLKVNVLLTVKQTRVQEKTISETKSLIEKYFPEAHVFQAASQEDLSAIARYHFLTPSKEERAEKLLYFIKENVFIAIKKLK